MSILFLVANDRLPPEIHPHAAAVIFISFAFLAPAIALAVLSNRVALAALLAGAVLIVDLVFYLKVVRGVSIGLSADCPLGLCWVTPSSAKHEVFGFAEFVTALALLVVVYTVTNVRYRFRVQIAPVPLYRLTYILLAIIGLGTLLSDLWFAEAWPLPLFLSDQLLWQVAFGLLFLLVAMAWLWFAFIRPPLLGKRNALRFTETLYRYILRGWDSELPTIADELIRSAQAIVRISNPHYRARFSDERNSNEGPGAPEYAHDLLLHRQSKILPIRRSLVPRDRNRILSRSDRR